MNLLLELNLRNILGKTICINNYFTVNGLRLIEIDGIVHENHLIDIHLNLIDF